MIRILQKKHGEYDAFVLSDEKNDLAECVYSFENAEILDVSVADGEEAIFRENVLRAALSRLDFAGKTKVICKNEKLGDFLSELGFEDTDGVKTVDTTTFFKPCCGRE